jgi:hypothetical protein
MRSHVVDPPPAPRQALLALLAALPDDLTAVREIGRRLGGDGGSETWAALVDEAACHGVLGVIAPHLADFDLPSSVRRSIEQRTGVGRLWHQHLVGALEHAVSALETAGIRVCVLKGPPLAERLYADPAVRPSMDIDLLIEPADVDRAADALGEAGYEGDSEASRSYLLRHAHHLHFSKPNLPPVELHFHAYAGFGVVVPASALMDRSTAYLTTEAIGVLVPRPEDEFVYLAIHAAGHSFIRLLWLYDLKLLVRRQPALDWERVAERAASIGVATAVAYTIRLLDGWLNVSIDGLPERLKRRGVRPRIADRLLTEVSTPQAPSTRDNLGGLLFTSLLCDTARSSAWLLQHHLLRTTRRRLKRLAPAYLPERWSV